jgi:hypothetical protein
VFKKAATHLDGPFFPIDATQPTTLRARLFGAQEPGLLGGGFFEGSRRQAACGGDGHVLHLAQIDIESRPVVAESLADDNFSPAFGEGGDAFEIFAGQLP